MNKPPCGVCGGRRHVWDEGRGTHVPCVCLEATRATRAYAEAGVPYRFLSDTWRKLASDSEQAGLPDLVRASLELKQGRLPGDKDPGFVVRGSIELRTRAGALMIRTACDGGLSAGVSTLPELIDIEFAREGKEIYWLKLLVLDIGGEPPHKWNRQVLGRALQDRWTEGLFTVITTGRDPSRLGLQPYKSTAIDAGLKRLRWVRLRGKA